MTEEQTEKNFLEESIQNFEKDLETNPKNVKVG